MRGYAGRVGEVVVISDIDVKENIAGVDADEVLASLFLT
uniref:Uncharacterized protein n=1 Tax=Candidatus Kentrum sp. TC TaxID=2126339 RepID=A0A451AH22_9GAMM|nr:MAG: hypothetical protein BECKTC1821E_GA0114239_11306 [Candidatus Kentron sp. TC]VFK65294.1 MAG: hypothetical protein BECKTC1821F_GA0114240_11772 [Candidatus Kentron sp. TC]